MIFRFRCGGKRKLWLKLSGEHAHNWMFRSTRLEVMQALTFIKEAAQDLENKNRPAKIFHLGDYDPSGQDAIKTAQYDLRGLAPKTTNDHGLEFKIIAVTPQQIQEMNLPTRPTKEN